jgi:hypothetical protein
LDKLTNAQKFFILVALYVLLSQGATPGGGPAPIKEPGLHVLYLYDTNKFVRAPKEIQSAINSNRVPALVGKNFARFSTSAPTETMPEPWKTAMTRPRPGMEAGWAIISNPGKGGYEGPIKTDDEMIELVKKYK